MKAIFFAASLIAGTAAAADTAQFPVKPIRLVVPFGAGSNTDVLARTVAVRMAEHWSQQVVVDNRPGARGNIGTDLVAKAPPDGYTIVLGAASVLAINQSLYSQMPYDSNTAFAPITNMVKTTNVLIVTPSLPVKSVQELIAYAKANPGIFNWAIAVTVFQCHLAGAVLTLMAGINLLHVPYKGACPLLVGVIAGYYIAAAVGVDETKGIDWIRWIISIAVAAVAVIVAATLTGRRGRTVTAQR